jgi:hypothetical protein
VCDDVDVFNLQRLDDIVGFKIKSTD